MVPSVANPCAMPMPKPMSLEVRNAIGALTETWRRWGHERSPRSSVICAGSLGSLADAEDVMALLRDYHAAIGEIIIKYDGTLERYAGDGVMVVFNDPVPAMAFELLLGK
jgi:hypothetical protein